ncbi:flavodoxin family protein [Psychromonas sp. MB-3u-54]|uniref:flavodoxin family protein n=1 Tax=Psychromonas sp. MB-3u-54 TaxID=2058319 RepID=UPI000C32D7E6|nr:flavodoxin family protein [Psychromonas sp. MB-3u-54]PKH03376.1 flavodoxin family protein [Psychromonas sp. MB-3u-54]
MNKILAINGSYRDGGITDQAVNALVKALESAGAEVEVILLRKYPIEFCRNCRECTLQPSESPGKCVQHDGMEALIKKIAQADGYILAAPTNFGSVTAIFKRFMERLIVYAYWPWDKNSPEFRKTNAHKKKAILVSSCAAPGMLGRFMYGTHKQLKMTAQTIGANTVGTLFTGLIAKDPQLKLANNIHRKIQRLSVKLLG